ncbi:MAG: 50S ribosomal protein L29 [Chloroflexota bacterium]
MKTTEARALDIADLKRRLDETYRELFNLRFQQATRQLTKTSEIRRVKKDIARIRTVLRERELGHAN